MAFLKRITPYAIAVLLLAVFYVRVPPPLRKTPYERLQTFSLYRADLPSVQATPYDFLMFVVQWPFAVCKDRENCTYEDLPNKFTIHGLWPQKNSSWIKKCTGKCFNLKEMLDRESLMANLNTSWPNLKRNNNMIFWSHEYNKHGRCCDDIFNQTEYFQKADEMWRLHPVELMFINANYTPGGVYKLVDLQNAVRKNTTKNPALRCGNYTENNASVNKPLLLEVVICYDRNGTGVIDCKPQLSNSCNRTDPIWWKAGTTE